MQAVAFRVRVGLDRRRQRPDPGREVGKEPRELTASTANRRPELGGIDAASELIERLRERTIRRMHHRVAGAVQDECAAAVGLGREFPGQTALAGAGLPTEQYHAPALSVRGRHQRAKPFELRRAPHEGKRRGKPERSRKVVHAAPITTIVRSDHRRGFFRARPHRKEGQLGS